MIWRVRKFYVRSVETLAGDLRVLHTADVPELRHLRNVVVFPCVGDRPEPSKMSGGDLDGDIYSVVWDERLLPPEGVRGERNYEPMEYDPPPKPTREAEGGVGIEVSRACLCVCGGGTTAIYSAPFFCQN